MNRTNKIYEIYEAEADLVMKQSSILLQGKQYSFNGELKTSGWIVENYIKELIKKHIPAGYRVCSGYVATSDNINNSENLLQHDIIVVDDRIPSIYKFSVGDIEVVPAEAVCGIFEIKRTLTEESAESAIEHLHKTYEVLENYREGIKSKHKALNNLVGATLSVATGAPVYGIISLDSDKKYDKEKILKAGQEFLDIVWSITTPELMHLAWFQDNREYFPNYASRRLDKEYGEYKVEAIWTDSSNLDILYGKAFSYLRVWINNTTGKGNMDSTTVQKYFGLS